MSTASVGRLSEYKVRNHLQSHGWVHIMRAAASKGPADLILAHPFHGVALVQVGRASKSLGPADRARLVEAAHLCSALALLAIAIPRQEIRYFLVTNDKPATWAEWSVA